MIVDETNTSGYFQPIEQVCPKCGYCSHCGRTPEYKEVRYNPDPIYTVWSNPRFNEYFTTDNG